MLKLVDVAEMNYLTSDKQPKGEIYIKGENVSAGYLNDEKKTKEEFDSDGWYIISI
jgi:long-chain acyl-CoA synthetase